MAESSHPERAGGVDVLGRPRERTDSASSDVSYVRDPVVPPRVRVTSALVSWAMPACQSLLAVVCLKLYV